MSTTINGVTVRIERNPDDWRKHQVTVQVASRKRPGLKASHSIDPGKCSSVHELGRVVGAAAALAAEHLGKKYKDIMDPSLAIRDGIRALAEEARLMGELARDVPAKLKRLKANQSSLSSLEQEVVGRMIWITDRGEKLTRDEGEWINQKVGALHGAQL